jgi:hypothetical protein
MRVLAVTSRFVSTTKSLPETLSPTLIELLANPR